MRVDSKRFKLTKLAEQLAIHTHHGQCYGENDYYQYHVLGVAGSFEASSDEYIVAILHDVCEDSDIVTMTIYNLFDLLIWKAVVAITRRKDEPYLDYITRVSQNETATRVKIADLKFHLSQPDPRNVERYTAALNYLQETIRDPLH